MALILGSLIDHIKKICFEGIRILEELQHCIYLYPKNQLIWKTQYKAHWIRHKLAIEYVWVKCITFDHIFHIPFFPSHTLTSFPPLAHTPKLSSSRINIFHPWHNPRLLNKFQWWSSSILIALVKWKLHVAHSLTPCNSW
jgi:hypothetical protein